MKIVSYPNNYMRDNILVTLLFQLLALSGGSLSTNSANLVSSIQSDLYDSNFLFQFLQPPKYAMCWCNKKQIKSKYFIQYLVRTTENL